MNSLFGMLGIETWKPFITALLLPPVPLLLLLLIGARVMFRRRGVGWLFILVGVIGIWLTSATSVAHLVSRLALHPPPALSSARIQALRADVKTKTTVAIVVLGGGVEAYAPEYGVSSLGWRSLERLRYGLWLARETGAPVAFSGGAGWEESSTTPEARVAANVAAQDFHHPLKWVEDQSRDTHENAIRSVALLREAGIKRIVLVTHDWHMPRAIANFQAAAGGNMAIEAAPMGLAKSTAARGLDWMPSANGFVQMRAVLREIAGRFFGA